MTRLPASEAAFASGKEEIAPFLQEAIKGAQYSSFAGTIVVCEGFKGILNHVHRPKPDDHPEDLQNGNFWKRHRDLDNNLSSIFMFLPDSFQLPQHVRDPAAIYANLNLHASVICLHHAALENLDKFNLGDSMKATSKMRLKTSAEEIVNIVKMTSHHTGIFVSSSHTLSLSYFTLHSHPLSPSLDPIFFPRTVLISPQKSPLCSLALYCATTVYVYLARDDPTTQVSSMDVSNHEIVIQGMQAIARHHKITNAFLQQAFLDIEHNGLSGVINIPWSPQKRDEWTSAIPLLARSSVSRHTSVAPVLPGKLPLGNPMGKAVPEGSGDPYLVPRGTDATVKKLINSDCYQPMLGAVSRNMASSSNISSAPEPANKRKRTAEPTPQWSEPPKSQWSEPSKSQWNDPSKPLSRQHLTPSIFGTTTSTTTTTTDFTTASFDANIFVLPDRSTPSNASSPAYRTTTTATGPSSIAEVFSGSDHSPSTGGLGNTPEENRVDFRAFQDKISGPIWSVEEEAFMKEMADSLVNGPMPGEVSEQWFWQQ